MFTFISRQPCTRVLPRVFRLMVHAALMMVAFASPAAMAGVSLTSANKSSVTGLGDTITYTFTISDENTIITGLSVLTMNAPVGSISCVGLPLDPFGTTTCTAVHTVDATDVGLGFVNQIAAGTYTLTTNAATRGGTVGGSTIQTPILAATVPNAPTIGTATAGNAQATVSFTAPGNDGGSAITGYTATAYIGGVAQALTSSGCTSSPCTVSGLSNGTTYTFNVFATNAVGNSPESAESNAVTPALLVGTVTLVKNTVGGNGSFDFVTNVPGLGSNIQTAGGTGQTSASSVPAGTYSIVETVPVGWQLTSATCSDGSPPNALALGAGESVTCTVTNTAAGGIIVDKVTLPAGSPQSFSFVFSGSSGPQPFQLTDAATPFLSGFLTPGTYSVAESAVAGWVQTEVTCTGQPGNVSQDPASINLAPGEIVTCRFTSTQNVSIPGAPTIGTATAGNASASVTFTAPGDDGGSAITGYTATAYIGGVATALTSSGCTSSPCTVSGLTNGTAYTFTVHATNAVGDSPESAESNAVTPQGTQTISFTSSAPGAATFGGSTYTPTATATSGLTVSFTIDAASSSVCSISGGVVSFIGVGTCTINANQAGNASFTAAPQVQQSFAVGQASQTISFTSSAPGAANVGGPTYTPTASATSGLAVSFTIDASASAVCSISSGTVSFIGGGTCIINANQAGNANYLPAPQVQQSFTVTAATVPGAPTIGTATAGNGNASVTFTPPTSDGGSPITSYTARAFIGGTFAGITGTCPASPCTVTGLTNGTAYQFRVRANNVIGFGTQSALSNTVTPAAPLPSLTVTDEITKEGNVGTMKTLTFRVRVSSLQTTPITVNFATVNGSATSPSDFTAGSGTVTIPAGTLAGTFSVKVIGDNTVEPNETMTVVISGAVGATIVDNTGVGTISNDDVASTATVMAYLPLATKAGVKAELLASQLDDVAGLLCSGKDAPAIAMLPALPAETDEALADLLALREDCAPYDLLRAEGTGALWLVDANRATASVRAANGASWLDVRPIDAQAQGLTVMSPEASDRERTRELRRWLLQHPDQALVVMGPLDEAERTALRRLGLSELDDQASPHAARALVNRVLGESGRARVLRGESAPTTAAATSEDDQPMLLIIEP